MAELDQPVVEPLSDDQLRAMLKASAAQTCGTNATKQS